MQLAVTARTLNEHICQRYTFTKGTYQGYAGTIMFSSLPNHAFSSCLFIQNMLTLDMKYYCQVNNDKYGNHAKL